MNRITIWFVLVCCSLVTGCGIESTATKPVRDSTNTPSSDSILGSETSTAETNEALTPSYVTPSSEEPTSGLETATLSNDFLSKDFFLKPNLVNCVLPCWQTIRIGQTTIGQAKSVLHEYYGPPLNEITNIEDLPIGFVGTLWAWDSPHDIFSVGVYFEESNDIVQGLRFTWRGKKYLQLISMQRILRELGTPDNALVSLSPGGQGQGRHVTMDLRLIYDSGVSFYYLYDLPYVVTTNADNPSGNVEFCLAQSYEPDIITASLTSSVNDDPLELTPLQLYLYGRGVLALNPLQDLINMNLDQLAESAMTDENYCIYFTVED